MKIEDHKYPKLIIVSSTVWDEDNSFGNTFSNLFDKWNKDNILNIYCEDKKPKNNVCLNYYQMSEKMILTSFFRKGKTTGRILKLSENEFSQVSILTKSQSKFISFVKKLHFQIFIWIRDLIWLIGNWKTKELDDLLKEFNADVLFFPMYTTFYMNLIQQYIVKVTKKKYVYFTSDDGCTFKQFSLSPLFWIDRFLKRFMFKKVIKNCEYIYVISEKQKIEYEKIFKKECKILTKGLEFEHKPELKNLNLPIKLVFTGNIGDGRIKTLLYLSKVIEILNKDIVKFKFDIYTYSSISHFISNEFKKQKHTSLHLGLPYDQIMKIQEDAHILVHVESFSLINSLKVRLSFSTKIVDYFSQRRCILAIGPANVNSIEYLKRMKAAIVSEKSNIYMNLLDIYENVYIINDFADRAWECGKLYHQSSKIKDKLYFELMALAN